MWIRSGHPACPTDGKPVIGKRKNKPHSKEHVQPSGPNTMLPGWNTGNELMFTVSGRGLEAARQLPVAQVCVQVASRSHAGTIPLASLCPDGVVGEGEHHHQSAEACILGQSRMQGELPQCCGHSICRNPSPPPAICRNPGPPPAICRNPGPPPAICRNPGPPPAICRNPGPPPAICRNPPTPHTLLHGLRLRKLTKARVRQCTADTSY